MACNRSLPRKLKKFKLATFNARGLQAPNMWGRFLDAFTRWSRRHKVGGIVVQEHNLHPDREGELRRACTDMGVTLVIGFAQAAGDGVHRGGVLLLVFDKEAKVTREIEVALDLVRVEIEVEGRTHDIAGVYAPAQAVRRVDMIQGLATRLGPDTIVGGDWNCVPDVTLDVQSASPLTYANVGASVLAVTMEGLNLLDIRREQLVTGKEHTRAQGGCMTRLDRWYVPVSERAAHMLWNVKVDDTLVWKDCPSDHLVVILDIEISVGEQGHERRTIREDLIARPSTQDLIQRTVTHAYSMGGNMEDKWTRAHNMMRHELLKLTDAERKRDAPRIQDLRNQIEVLRRKAAQRGPSPNIHRAREKLHKELLSLERPEAKLDDKDTAKKMADRSDKCTKAYFRSYKDTASQQWINEMKVAFEWKDGEEPSYSWTDEEGGHVSGRTKSPKEVAGTVREYYKMLFAEKLYDKDEFDTFMSQLGERPIARASAERLDKPISDLEITRVMENLPLGKQPGPDRIPNAVYKYMSHFFAPKLGALLRMAAQLGTLPNEMRKGDIGILHKKGERDEVRNYRPITLLQNSYKIFTRILAKRMASVVHEFVAEAQKGFVPHTFIADCSMLLNLIETYVNDDVETRKGIMVFLDMEKAFDRVSYDFLIDGLKAIGFGPNFVKTVGMMYNTERPPQRRIYANGYYSEWFDIKSGVAQGCPLSPLLFLIVAQGLKIAVGLEGVKGITIGGVTYTLSQFADDTTLILRDTDQLRPAFRAIRRWCRATGMRENIKKREGLALGSYRGAAWNDPAKQGSNRRQWTRSHKIAAGIAWAQEGSWVISLGVPVGNELDHTKWWNAKIKATRDKANRWSGLYRSSYFGRNLVVQAMYFGRLRYWLWSLPMGKETRQEVQRDADRLWWSKDPILDGEKRRIKRFVAHRTAIGPRKLGGVGVMDWSDHVDAVLASWILKYLHPAYASWKELLDYMLFRDANGHALLGGERPLLMCELTRAQKYRLLKNLPKKATYIRMCLLAHWKVGLRQDLEDESKHDGLGAESLWHNPRFPIDCNGKVRWYFVNVMNITQISDLFDYETNAPFDDAKWETWIVRYHRDHRGTTPRRKEIDERLAQIADISSQVPGWIIGRVGRPIPCEPKLGSVVALIRNDAQDEDGDVVEYAITEEGELAGSGMRGSWFHIQNRDTVGLLHPTGDRWPKRQTLEEYGMYEVAWWGDRAAGPVRSRVSGWLMDGESITLNERMIVNRYTRALTMRRFRPPTAEAGWDGRLTEMTPWKLAWGVRGRFTTPRDQITQVKLMRRNLFTAVRDDTTDGNCMCCGEPERQQHLAECVIIRREFWSPILRLMHKLGWPTANEWGADTAMVITFRVSDTTVVETEQADLIFVAWRCLYAELVHARVEKTRVQLHRALARAISMLISRVTAVGETWLHWVNTHTRTTKTSIVPATVRCRNDLIEIGAMGNYVVNAALTKARDAAMLDHARPDTNAARGAQRPPEATPPTRAGGYLGSPAYGAIRSAYVARYGEQWWHADHLFHSYEAECRSMDTAALQPRTPLAPPQPAQTAAPRPDPARDHLAAERDAARAHRELSEADPHRDMSGDAVTYRREDRDPMGAVSEYALSAARNLARDESLTREAFEEHYVGGSDLFYGVRFPNWGAFMTTLQKEGETKVHFSLADITDHGLLLGIRVMVLLTCDPSHAVAYVRRYPRFLKYDSDSKEKTEGTYETIYTIDMLGPGRAVALTTTNGHLHHAIIENERRQKARAIANLDPRRDMAHDALTTAQATFEGVHAQCSLAVARNLMRDPTVSAASLAEDCVAHEYPGDIRTPDWPRVLTSMALEGEVVKRGTWGSVPTELYLDMRLAVSICQAATHVVGLVRDDDTFRLYDNDSEARVAGTYSPRTPEAIRAERAGDCFFALILDSSALSATLGPAITTQVHRARARTRTGLPPDGQPPSRRLRTE